jgi:hypothetical protein
MGHREVSNSQVIAASNQMAEVYFGVLPIAPMRIASSWRMVKRSAVGVHIELSGESLRCLLIHLSGSSTAPCAP